MEAPRTIREVAIPLATNVTSSIRKPNAGGRFELKQNMVQLLHSSGQFTGLPSEDPQQYIRSFLEISDTYIPAGVSTDYVRLKLFPFSLLGEAKRWLHSEPPNSITTYDDLARNFLIRFFPSGKTAKLRSDILSFKKREGENLYQAWDRFKSMLKNCPHHHQANEVLVHTFIEDLDPNTKILLDSAEGGQALEKTYDELYKLLNHISQGNPEWNGDNSRSTVKKVAAGMIEVDAITALMAQLALFGNQLSTHFGNMSLGQQAAPVNAVQQTSWCEICGSGEHTAELCRANPDSVNFVGNAQRDGGMQNYGNTYNPSWKTHPNFSWEGNQNQYRSQGQGPNFQHQGQEGQSNA